MHKILIIWAFKMWNMCMYLSCLPFWGQLSVAKVSVSPPTIEDRWVRKLGMLQGSIFVLLLCLCSLLDSRLSPWNVLYMMNCVLNSRWVTHLTSPLKCLMNISKVNMFKTKPLILFPHPQICSTTVSPISIFHFFQLLRSKCLSHFDFFLSLTSFPKPSSASQVPSSVLTVLST